MADVREYLPPSASQALAVAGLSIVGEGSVGLLSFHRAALPNLSTLLCPTRPGSLRGVPTQRKAKAASAQLLLCFLSFCVNLAAGTSGN